MLDIECLRILSLDLVNPVYVALLRVLYRFVCVCVNVNVGGGKLKKDG